MCDQWTIKESRRGQNLSERVNQKFTRQLVIAWTESYTGTRGWTEGPFEVVNEWRRKTSGTKSEEK